MRFVLCFVVTLISSYSFSWDHCTGGPNSTTPAQACAAMGYAALGAFVGGNSTTAEWYCNNASGVPLGVTDCSNNFACPAGTQLNNTSGACELVCPSGQSAYNGACAANCSSAAQLLGFPVAAGAQLQLGSPNQCVGSCGFVIVDIVDIDGKGNNCVTNSDGTKRCYMDANGTGQHCSGSSSASVASSTPTSTTSTTNTSTPPTTTPPGTVPTQSGTTISTTESSTSSVNPDGSVTTTTTTVTTTTNPDGSTSTSTRVGTSTQQGGNGKGQGTGTGTGTGDGTGGDCDPTSKDYLNCMAGEQTPVEHTHGEAQNFGDAMNNFEDGLKQTPIGGLASASGIGGSVNVGSCPTATFDLFGHSVVMDSHCAIYDSVGPTLTTIMHVFYVVIGILIILSA